MADTPNHEYNVPDQGDQDWHNPLNENFEAFEVDIELRDQESNLGEYTPTDGAKFLATDTGVVYVGDGSDWTAAFVHPGYDESANEAQFPDTVRAPEIDTDSLTGQLTGGQSLTDIAGTNLSISNGQLDASTGGGGGGISGLSGGDGIEPASIGDGDTLSVAWDDANDLDNDGNVTGGGGNDNWTVNGDLLEPSDSSVDGIDVDEINASLLATGGDGLTVTIAGNSTIFHGRDADSGRGGNVVMGHSSNLAAPTSSLEFPEGATISGGGYDTGSVAQPNKVYDHFGTVGGGQDNEAGSPDDDLNNAACATVGGGRLNKASARFATVSGGFNNTAEREDATVGGGEGNAASGVAATVGGGDNNTASSRFATVSGGESNTASGTWGTVSGGFGNTTSGNNAIVPGGSRGAAESDHSFVWNDGSAYHEVPETVGAGLSSDTAVNGEPVTGLETFSVSAQGGVRFITGSSNVTYIDGGTAGWSTTSTQAAKTNIDPVDPEEILAGVEGLEVATWEYENQDGEGAGTTHVGPMAEDFHDIVDVGSSDDHINGVNADGVLFAAVQGLSAKLDKKDDRIDDQQEQIDALEAENDRLRDRLAAVEDHLGFGGDVAPAPADD